MATPTRSAGQGSPAAGELALVFEKPGGGRTKPALYAMTALKDGAYTADLLAAELGTYHLRIRVGPSAERWEQRLAVTIDYPDELILGPPDEGLLASVAKATDGQVLTDPAPGIPTDGRMAVRRIQFWPILVMGALVLLTLEIVIRRWKQSPTVLHPPDGAAAWCDRPMRVP
jgi:hypothetical protein